MIVCQCTGKTDRQVKKAVAAGARSTAEVMRACEAGGCCGGCTPLIERLIRMSGPRRAVSHAAD